MESDQLRKGMPMADEWLTAGVFARRSRLSPKALRLYGANGVLVPVEVDESNGYRRYHETQLRDARLVRMLRGAGVPLALVAEILRAPRKQQPALILDYWDEVERTIRFRRQLIAHLTQTLPDSKETYVMMEIKTREVPDQTILTEQAFVDAMRLPSWIAEAGMRQIKAAEEIGGQVGPSMVIYHGEVNEDSDGPVEAALPIAAERVREVTVATRVEPAHQEAYTTVTRAQIRYPDILSAYDSIERWISRQGHTVTGPPRELYFADPSTGPEDEPVADIAFPIEPAIDAG